MASVQLQALWISDVLHLDVSLVLHTTKFIEKSGVSGQVQTYASGRQRAVTSVGLGRTIDCQLTLVEPAAVATFESWVGHTLLLRDPFGFRDFVTFFDYQRDQQPAPAVSDVTVTFRAVTYDESV